MNTTITVVVNVVAVPLTQAQWDAPLLIDGKTHEERVADMKAEHAAGVKAMFANHPPEMTPGTPEWNASFAAFDKRWEERYANPASIFYKGPQA